MGVATIWASGEPWAHPAFYSLRRVRPHSLGPCIQTREALVRIKGVCYAVQTLWGGLEISHATVRLMGASLPVPLWGLMRSPKGVGNSSSLLCPVPCVRMMCQWYAGVQRDAERLLWDGEPPEHAGARDRRGSNQPRCQNRLLGPVL